MKLSKNFRAKEFMCRCEHPNCEANTPEKVKQYISMELIRRAQELRDLVGRPMQINSGIRCQYHPIEAKKIKKRGHGGRHWVGDAVDFNAPTSAERYEIMEAAFKLKFKGIAYQKKFVHIDIRDVKDGLSWNY